MPRMVQAINMLVCYDRKRGSRRDKANKINFLAMQNLQMISMLNCGTPLHGQIYLYVLGLSMSSLLQR
jgi:hypothetical protein